MDGLETSTVSSGADLMASVPADLFDGGDVSTDETIETTPDETEAVAEPEAEIETAEEAPAEEEPVEEAEPEEAVEEEKPVEQAKDEDLPDGVKRGKDRNGKEGLWLTPQRYEQFHGAHKSIREMSELLGEPLTRDAVDLRNRAYIGQEKLYGDLLSGDPQTQANVLSHFFDEGARALQEGAVGTDPNVGLADAFYKTIREKSPDGYAAIRINGVKDLAQEMFEYAAEKGDKNVWYAMQHVIRAVAGLPPTVDPTQMREVAQRMGLPWYAEQEMQNFAKAVDPAEALRRENAQLKSELNGRQTNNQAAQLEQWATATKQAVSTALLEEAIKPALTEHQVGLWEKKPEAFERLVVNPLHSVVRETVLKDPAFANRIELLDAAARRATSAQKRAEYGEQIKQAYINRARLAVDAHKGKILSDAAQLLKGQSDATHQRLAAAQNVRGPKGPASPVQRSIVPKGLGEVGGKFDPETAYKDMQRLFA